MSIFSASEVASNYERNGERLTQPINLQILDRIGPLSSKRLIDVAAGTGGIAYAAAERGACVLATDFSPAMVARTAERLAAFEGCKAQQMHFEHLDVEDATFEIAISMFGLLAYSSWAKGLQEMFRVTRQGGVLALSIWTHRIDCTPAHLLKRVFESYFPNRKLWPENFAPIFTQESLQAAMQQAGGENVTVRVETTHWSPESSAGVVDECSPMFARFPGYAALSDQERKAFYEPLQAAFMAYSDVDGIICLSVEALVVVGTKNNHLPFGAFDVPVY